MPLKPRQRCAHKGNMGHVLVVGGDLGYSGAARMAGEAVLRVGAGLVTIATRCEHAGLLNLTRPELMIRGVVSYLDIENLLDKANVVVLGPGLGTSTWGKDLFDAVLMTDKPTVLDADGFNLLPQSPKNRYNWILTPQPGEAGRLLQSTTPSVQPDRFAADFKKNTYYCQEKISPFLSHGIPQGHVGVAKNTRGDVLKYAIVGPRAYVFAGRVHDGPNS